MSQCANSDSGLPLSRQFTQLTHLFQATTIIPPLPELLQPAISLLPGEEKCKVKTENYQEGGVNVNINVNFNIYPPPPPIHGFPPSTDHQPPGNPAATVMGEYAGHVPGGHHGQYPGGHLHPQHYPAFFPPPYTPIHHPTAFNQAGNAPSILHFKSRLYYSVPCTIPVRNVGEPFEPLQDPYDRARRKRRRTGDPAHVSGNAIACLGILVRFPNLLGSSQEGRGT